MNFQLTRPARATLFASVLPLLLGGCGKGGGGGTAPTTHACAATSSCNIHLTWNPVTTTVSGNPITVAGYKIYWGTASGQYDHVVDVGNATQTTLSGFGPGTYYFAATAYLAGYTQESAYSNEANAATAPAMAELKVVIH